MTLGFITLPKSGSNSSELEKKIRYGQLVEDLEFYISYLGEIPPEVFFRHRKNEINLGNDKTYSSKYKKARNWICRQCDVDYRVIDEIVLKNNVIVKYETERKLRRIAETVGLSVLKISDPTSLLFAFNTANPSIMYSNTPINVLCEPKDCTLSRMPNAETSWHFADVMDRIQKLSLSLTSKFPVDPLEYHGKLVPDFCNDQETKNLFHQMKKYNIVLYGNHLRRWLSDEENWSSVFLLAKYKDEKDAIDSNPVEIFNWLSSARALGKKNSQVTESKE